MRKRLGHALIISVLLAVLLPASLAGIGQPVLAAAVPAVTTEVATSVGTDSATLNGTITDTGGENADIRGFDYGATADYGSEVTENGSFDIGAFSQVLSGLSPETTYHFRAKAHNSVGWSYGADMEFTTGAAAAPTIVAPTVTTQAATDIGSNGSTLNGEITDTGGENADIRGFDYGTTTDYGLEVTETGSFDIGAFSQVLSGLSPSTTYHFRAKAHNSAGWSYGAALEFTTGALPRAITPQAIITSAATGNWNAGATWVGGVVPTASDDVIIASGHTVTVTAAAQCASITFNAPAAAGGITISLTNTLTVTGAIVMNAATAASTTTLAVGTGTLNAGSITISGATTATYINQVTVITGTINVTGNVTFNSGTQAVSAVLTATGAAVINIGGDLTGAAGNGRLGLTNTANWYLGGNYTFAGTLSHTNRMLLTLNGTGAQTINGTNTFRKLTVNKSAGTASAGAIITINNVGVTVTAGTLDLSTYANVLVGVLTVSSGATLKVGGTEDIAGFTTYTLSATSTVEFYGAAQTVAAQTYGNLTLSGSGAKTTTGVTVNGTLSMQGTATATAAPTYGASAVLEYAGSSTQTTGPELTATIPNLTINNASGVTLGVSATVNGTLTLTSGNLTVTDPKVLTMGASATTTGATDVTGIVKRTTLVADTYYTFGNQYTTINFHNMGTLPTDMSIKITIGSAPSWKSGAIQRTYDIIRTGGSGSMAVVHLHYLDAELNGNTENKLVFWDCDTPFTPGSGVEDGRSTYDTTNNWVGVLTYDVSEWNTSFAQKAWTLGDTAITTSTWNGSISTVWTVPNNWTPVGVPNDTTSIVIPDASGTNNDPTLLLDSVILKLEIQSGGILNSGTTSTLTISGSLGAWLNRGTFNPSTGTVIFTGGDATLVGTTTFYNVTINPSAMVTIGSATTMSIGGAVTNNGKWNAAGLSDVTVEYNGGAQTVLNPNGNTPGYSSLILSGSGTKTMPGTALSILWNFSMSGTASATAGASINTTGSFTVGSGTSFTTGAFAHAIGGDFSNSGTFTATGSTVTLNGTSAQAIGGTTATTFNNLTINNANGVTLNSSPTISGTLTLTSGNITTTVSYTVIIPASGSVSYTSGHVVGNLQKNVATGATSRTFEVGTANNYNPVTVAFGSVTVAGNLTAKATAGDHGSLGLSTIDPSLSVNVYWTLTNSGITFDNYSATFTFASGDKDVGVDTSSFIVGKYTSSTWSYPTVGTKTATSTQATGISSFGDFAVGEPLAPNISNTPSSYDFGVLAEGAIAETTGGLTTAYFTITNNSAFAVNITISGTDMTGGTAWTLSDTATQGSDTYGLKAGLEGGSYSIIVKSSSPNFLVEGLASLGTQDWGLQILAPTPFTGGGANSGTVTLTATEAWG